MNCHLWKEMKDVTGRKLFAVCCRVAPAAVAFCIDVTNYFTRPRWRSAPSYPDVLESHKQEKTLNREKESLRKRRPGHGPGRIT